MAELIIQLQSWKFIEFLTTVDTCSAINHRSLLLQREQTLQKRSSVATDLRTMRPQLEILLKAVPPFNSNMIILQKVVSCVCGRRGGTPPERWRSPRIGRQLLEPGRYYGGALRTTPAPLRTPRTYIGATLRRPPTTPLSVARTYFAGTAPSNALHV